MNSSNVKLLFALNIIDSILLIVSYYIFFFGVHLYGIYHQYSLIIFFLFGWIFFAKEIELNKKLLFGSLFGKYSSIGKVYLLLIVFTTCISFLNTQFDIYKLLIFINLFFISKIVISQIIIICVRRLRKKGRILRKVLIVGNQEKLTQLKHYIENNLNIGYKVTNEISYTFSKDDFEATCKLLNNQIKESPDLDEVIFVMPLELNKQSRKLVDICDFHGINVKHMPYYSFLASGNKELKIEMFDDIPLLNLRQYSLNNFSNLFFKRTFDIVFSLFVLIALCPLFIIIFIMIKVDSSGPIFYKPVRVGRNGKKFVMYKFRSMKTNDCVNVGLKSTEINDPRITKIGAIIRKASIDELPQFLNVLIGDMSVVGPRPHRIFLNDDFQSKVENYMLRHYFKPGITGWAQVNGWRGATDTMEQKINRTKFDLYYIENRTFWFDLKIIWLTIFDSKTFKNAY